MQFPGLDFADFIFIGVGLHVLLSVVYFADWQLDTEARLDSGSILLARLKEVIYSFIWKHIISCLFGFFEDLIDFIEWSMNQATSHLVNRQVLLVSFWNISSHWCSMSASIIHWGLQNGDIPFLSFMKCISWSLYKENFPTAIWLSNGTVYIRKLR